MQALGDRIAIMNEGLVKCCGTPMFLKRIFSAGYHLRISKNELFDSQFVLNIVKNFMPNAQIKSEINAEIIYSLESEDSTQNSDQNSSTSLANLFDELERRSTKLGINSCGLTVTTMEDVFLRVGNECNDNEMFSKTSNGYRDAVNGSQEKIINSLNKNFGHKLRLQQFYALFLKRFHYAKRYWPMIILQLILPAILFMCILLLDNSIKKSIGANNISPLELNLKMYGNTEGFIRSDVPEIPKSYTEFASKQSMKTENISSMECILCEKILIV
jgi:ATP-binding cassette subfamily A (ABC1) protein 3